jgi:hypothetical protein
MALAVVNGLAVLGNGRAGSLRQRDDLFEVSNQVSDGKRRILWALMYKHDNVPSPTWSGTYLASLAEKYCGGVILTRSRESNGGELGEGNLYSFGPTPPSLITLRPLRLGYWTFRNLPFDGLLRLASGTGGLQKHTTARGLGTLTLAAGLTDRTAAEHI